MKHPDGPCLPRISLDPAPRAALRQKPACLNLTAALPVALLLLFAAQSRLNAEATDQPHADAPAPSFKSKPSPYKYAEPAATDDTADATPAISPSPVPLKLSIVPNADAQAANTGNHSGQSIARSAPERIYVLPAHPAPRPAPWLEAQAAYPQQPFAAPSQAYPPPGYGQPMYAQPQPYAAQPYVPQQYPSQQAVPRYAPQQQYAPQQGYGQQQYAPQQDDGQQQAPAQSLDAEQLEQLAAPIALYPDALVAQILAAATYPAQVVAADHWRQSLGYAPNEEIAAGANAEPWDPSVKALTAFPQVLAEMDRNLQWTTDLGNAYYNQPQDVLQTVQVLRQRAQQAGTLQNSSYETVSYNQGYIQLAPPNPDVVYVPQYDPWTAYGQPVQPYQGFSLLNTLGSIGSAIGGFAGGRSGVGGGYGGGTGGSSLMQFGLGIAMSAFSHTQFGWLGWALNWLGNSVLFHNSSYQSQSTTVAHWNSPGRGGSRFPSRPLPTQGLNGQRGDFSRAGNGFNGGGQGFTRPPDRIAENRPEEPQSRGFAPNDGNRVRPAFGGQPMPSRPQPYASRPQEPFNRQPQYESRMQEPARPGTGFMGRSGEGYNARPGGYGNPAPVYRAPAAPQRNSFKPHYAEPSQERAFAGAYGGQQRGGSQFFGGRPGGKSHFDKPHTEKAPHYEKPKAFKEPKMKGGHSSGGGHSSHLFGGAHRL